MTTETRPYDAWNVDEYAFPRHDTIEQKLKFLLNYAVLAPSLHNTQPWKFEVQDHQIRVFADFSRHLPVADSDARELYMSIGCAIENLLIAARHFNLSAHVAYFSDIEDQLWVATLSFREHVGNSSLNDMELFYAIPLRHTNRQTYVNKPLSERDIQSLQACVNESEIRFQLTDDYGIKESVNNLLISADITQFADPDYRNELNNWITQGEFGYRWLVARIGQLATTYQNSHRITTKPDADVVLNAPLLALMSTTTNDRLAQIHSGQVFERIALTATMLNIGIQPLSQILQVSDLKQELSALFGTTAPFAQMVFRLGYTDVAQDATSRRGIHSVIKTP